MMCMYIRPICYRNRLALFRVIGGGIYRLLFKRNRAYCFYFVGRWGCQVFKSVMIADVCICMHYIILLSVSLIACGKLI